MTVDASNKGKRSSSVEVVRPEAADDDQIQAGSIRFGKLVSLWSQGELSAIQFTKATAVCLSFDCPYPQFESIIISSSSSFPDSLLQARLNTKVQTAMSTVAPKAQVDQVADANQAQYMEGGWARRGKGSAFFRTLVSAWMIVIIRLSLCLVLRASSHSSPYLTYSKSTGDLEQCHPILIQGISSP